MPFVFSCDGHVVEPSDLFDALPPSLIKRGVRTEKQDGMLVSHAGDRVTSKLDPLTLAEWARQETG